MVDEKPLDEIIDAREGQPTGEYYKMTEAEQKARDKRNMMVALSVVGFIILVFTTTVLRLVQNANGTG